MPLAQILVIAVALALDALTVALATGLTLPRVTGRQTFRLAFHFGLFQALMPVLGWLAGLTVRPYIEAWDHWVAFALLGAVGAKMIADGLRGGGGEGRADPTRGWTLVVLAVATSIDALAVGLSLAVLGVEVWFPALVIGLVAAALTAAGLHAGRWVGGIERGARWSGVVGGLVLLAIGLRILWEHGALEVLTGP